jgi:hypothetical protein
MTKEKFERLKVGDRVRIVRTLSAGLEGGMCVGGIGHVRYPCKECNLNSPGSESKIVWRSSADRVKLAGTHDRCPVEFNARHLENARDWREI